MSEPQHDQVACPHCGKLHVWTSATATRSIRCACGKPMLMPDTPTGRAIPVSDDRADFELAAETDPDAKPAASPARSPADNERDLYSLAADEDAPAPASPHKPGDPRKPLPPLAGQQIAPTRCSSCNQTLKTGAVVCVNCGYHVQVGMLLETARPSSDPDAPPGEEEKPLTAVAKALAERVDNVDTHDVRDYYAPLILIAVGLLWRLVYETMWNSGGGITHFAWRNAMDVVFTFPLLLGALMMVATAFKTTFGSLTTTSIKALAIIILPAIIGDIMTAWLGGFAWGFPGMILTFSLLFGAYLTMFLSLFDLDITEATAAAVALVFIHYLFRPLFMIFVLPRVGIYFP